MKLKKVVVVIPIYKECLDEFEKISLQQAVSILKNYEIVIIMPENLEFDNVYNLKVEKFSNYCFKSVKSYNALMLTKAFYERFINYEFMLIYQLDAFVFKDELMKFCDLDYDYIGAPWLSGKFCCTNPNNYIWNVGNGGFSLRKIESCIILLDKNKYLLEESFLHEDIFFSMGEKVAPLEIALSFSFETQVRKCFEINKSRLPFGCHAWKKYDLSFWKPYIEGYGYHVILKDDNGRIDLINKDLYCLEKKINNYIENCFKKENLLILMNDIFLDKKRECIIWGAGTYGVQTTRMLKYSGVSIKCIIDKNIQLRGKKISEIIIDLPELVLQEQKKYNIIISVKKYREEIEEFLVSLGYRYKKDYIFFEDINKLYMDKNI